VPALQVLAGIISCELRHLINDTQWLLFVHPASASPTPQAPLIPNLIPSLLLALAGWALVLAARAIVREARRHRLEEEAQVLRQCPELLEIVASGKRH
jgi:hypothetical protein